MSNEVEKEEVAQVEDTQNDLEMRGRQAGDEIKQILVKYNLALSVDLRGLEDFVKGLKETLQPILVDNTSKQAKE